MIRPGELGVYPPGALGVGFFIHASAECFIGRSGDGITQFLKESGSLRIADGPALREVPLKGRIFANLLEADARESLPELLFVCCNPDQLAAFAGEMTKFIESLVSRNRLSCEDDIRSNVPILLVLPNGILSEYTLQTYADQLNEAMLMERLPGVTDAMVLALLDRVVRGISLQAGGRRGSGANTEYVLQPRGTLVFAGGGETERQRIETILTAHHYPFTHVRGVPGTRVEFDKAMISIVLNVGGLIHIVKPGGAGELIDLRMGDLCKDPSKDEFVDEITRAVFNVGQAIGAYPREVTYNEIWAEHRATILKFANHVTSSLKTFRDALGAGLKSVKLFSNEEWILTPLAQYAAKAGMQREEALFRSLGRRVQQSMAAAIKFCKHVAAGGGNGQVGASGGGGRSRTMRLTAQRNIGIELFEMVPGSDDVVLAGTLLDNEHLIKLELTVHLPDEQITRSRLEMVRVPFPVCHEVEAAAEHLIGLRIERGVLGEIGRRVGGRSGCSHIRELATAMVNFIASHLVRRRAGVDPFSLDFAGKPAEERFRLTRDLLRDSCLAYSQLTSIGLDESIGIRRVGQEHNCPIPLGDFDPSLGKLLRDRTRRFGGGAGDKVYIRYRAKDRDFSITWTEFERTVLQIARNLIDRDIRKGDRIAMISENRAEMFMFEMAAMSIGAVSVPVFAGYPAPQISYVLRHARPRLAVVSGQHQLDKIERERFPWIEAFFCMDFGDGPKKWGALPFANLTAPGGAIELELEARIDSVKPDDLCMVMYTSGTTGPPKGVRLCHRNIISQQKAISLLWDVSDKDVFMSYLPWHHSFGGLFERFMTLYNGCELCLDDSAGKDIDRLIANWRAYDPSLFFSVPRLHDLLQAHCREDAAVANLVFGGRLRFVFTAGAPLPATVQAAYAQRKIPVLEGWGLTETSPCVTCTRLDSGWKSGYVGQPIPGVSVRIDNDQEILVKGPNIMQGYLDDEEMTSHVIDENGWFHTGDLGEFTREGLRIFGRKDGAFKLTTGEKVHPHRIESTLANESNFISIALVLGSGKDFTAALVYPNFSRLREWAAQQNLAPLAPGSAGGYSAGGLIDHPAGRELFAAELNRINGMIEVKYHRVKRAVLADREPSLERGELTPSGKIVRERVCDIYKQKIEQLFNPAPPDGVIEVGQQSYPLAPGSAGGLTLQGAR